MLLLGIDLGSSSIKLSVVDSEAGCELASVTAPKQEMPIISVMPGYAEQDPDQWCQHLKSGIGELRKKGIDTKEIGAIGIAYQMHGLVCLDQNLNAIRPAIIWCDSRAVEIGHQGTASLGKAYCKTNLLNELGNFTASRWRWLLEHEPLTAQKIRYVMLPGDYIATRLSGLVTSTASGLSEAILWDYSNNKPATSVIQHWGLNKEALCPLVESFSVQCTVSRNGADEFGLKCGTPISYRAGDQPNNAIALRAINKGDIASTAGTSAVLYACSAEARADPCGRLNTFLHPTPSDSTPLYGLLMCINGGAHAYAWLRRLMRVASYDELNKAAENAPPGSEGLKFLPFGNGSERILLNHDPKAAWKNLDFNRHDLSHMARSVQEGIAFAMQYGLELIEELGSEAKCIKAAHANLFLSASFAQTVSALSGLPVEIYKTSGAQGAARAAGYGVGYYSSLKEALSATNLHRINTPEHSSSPLLQREYQKWRAQLNKSMNE